MTNNVKPLIPIKTNIVESLRMMKQSYANPLEHSQFLQQRFGNVVMQRAGSMKFVHLFGPEANRLSLVNPGQILSNKKSWDKIIGRIFPNGLMLRDGDDHRYHRRLMQAGFKKEAIQRYLLNMTPLVKHSIGQWAPGDMLVYPTLKQMTLELAASVFLGMDLGDDARKINTAFETTVAASMPRIPVALPGTLLWRGIRSRKVMCDFFLARIDEKRASDGQDLFSLLCHAVDEDGNRYTDQEIVDHIIFLMMAAHDTTTSSLTSMIYALAKHPEWQERLFAEVSGLGETLTFEDLSEMTETSWVMKEALRRYPPLSTLPKYSNQAFEFEGFQVPADAMVITYPIHTHHMSELWDKPYDFDPLRFSEQRAEHKRHPYSWIPFSGGAHMCIGLHFAEMQIKLVMFELLKRYQWSVPEGYEMPVQQSPISKPKDDLPIRICAR